MTKMGMKRTEKKLIQIKQISTKEAKRLGELASLKKRLIYICANRSELSGKMSDWRTSFLVEPHHIDGREGVKLLDPFNIIMLTREEHIEEGKHHTFDRIQELLAFIKTIRIKQGFKQEVDYGSRMVSTVCPDPPDRPQIP